MPSSNVETVSKWDLFSRYSSLSRLVRTMALILRFVERISYRWNLRKCNGRIPPLHADQKSRLISAGKLNIALITLTMLSQKTHFPPEYKSLTFGKPLLKSSSLLRLRPFLDHVGYIRVGGRIQRSFLSYNKKNPLVFSKFSNYHVF